MQRGGTIQRVILASSVTLSSLVARPSAAQQAPAEPAPTQDDAARTRDRFTVSGRSETYVQLYRRALVPGQNGALVPTELAIPIHEYVFANARNVDAPWQKDSIGIEFAAWGRLWPTSSDIEQPFDGDVQTANVRLEAGPGWLRLGRQQIAGGAARYARFDGLMVGAKHRGLFAEGYAGFTVLPRWNGQPGYHRLGDQEDSLLTFPLEDLDRADRWLAGGRLGYQTAKASGSLSFHDEETAGGVQHRNLGLDVGVEPLERTSAGASALLELDSGRLGDVRLWFDATPHPLIDVGAEVLHVEPALLLARQSVFSVFTTNTYDEVGATLTARVQPWLRIETNGYIDAYEDAGAGARGQLALRFSAGKSLPTFVRLAYSRVLAPENGYQALRASFSRKLTPRLGTTLEAYGYVYDNAIRGFRTSSIFAGTASYQALDRLELMWSATLARSPYAAVDAQTMLRATYRFDSPALARLQ
jgi:hypothetical protein